MQPLIRQRGVVLLMAILVLVLAIAGWAAAEIAGAALATRRDALTDRALAQAREALIAHAADRPITAWVGPGYLPCPDRDDDGWAESTCGSQNGELGQRERLGRLPWKTLGLPDLRDGHGERLWYAVSSKYKGLLNCAPNRACIDTSPQAALGTITVRDAMGTVLQDGTLADPALAERGGAAAVVIAPGPPIARPEREQRRDCGPLECNPAGHCLLDPPWRVAKCDPVNYLDKAVDPRHGGEDNADFVDRNDAPGRALNGNGFVQGPIRDGFSRVLVNDRLAVVGYRDVMPRIMQRVALEVAHCLRFYASRPENAGRYPWPTPACRQALTGPQAWADAGGVLFGRIPDTPFSSSRTASGGAMLERWWRNASRTPEALDELPVRDPACRIAFPPDDEGDRRRLAPGSPAEEGRTAGIAENAWWTYWKPYVFYALARSRSPSAPSDASCGTHDCLALLDETGATRAEGKHFAVIVAGAPLLEAGQRRGPGTIAEATHWLERESRDLERSNPNPPSADCSFDPARRPCVDGSCRRIASGPTSLRFNDAVVAHP